MKQIINGKRYDTETAAHIARGGNNLGGNNFHHYEEDLYRTTKGNWFLIGSGGPASKYAEPAPGGGMTGSSNKFIVLTDQEAYEWLERNEETTEIEQYFGDEIENA